MAAAAELDRCTRQLADNLIATVVGALSRRCRCAGNGTEVVTAAAELRKFIAENDMAGTVKKLSVNEYSSMWAAVPPLPAVHVSFLANFERARIDSAMHTCWSGDPQRFASALFAQPQFDSPV